MSASRIIAASLIALGVVTSGAMAETPVTAKKDVQAAPTAVQVVHKDAKDAKALDSSKSEDRAVKHETRKAETAAHAEQGMTVAPAAQGTTK